jgi:hypothetical protein
VNKSGSVSIKLYLWTQKLNLHITKYFDFLNYLKSVKTIVR